jgi:hypothetical protein
MFISFSGDILSAEIADRILASRAIQLIATSGFEHFRLAMWTLSDEHVRESVFQQVCT